MVDSSWALANRGDGTFDRWLLFGTTLPQYVTWLLGTVVGAFSGDLLGDTDRLRARRGLPDVLPRHPHRRAAQPPIARGRAAAAPRSRWRWCRSPRPAYRSWPPLWPRSWGCADDDLVDHHRARGDHGTGQGGRACRVRRPGAAPGLPPGGGDDGARPAGRARGHLGCSPTVAGCRSGPTRSVSWRRPWCSGAATRWCSRSASRSWSPRRLRAVLLAHSLATPLLWRPRA